MKCEHVQQKILDYSEKLLNERDQAQIEEHLHRCATCTQELREIEQTLDLLQAVPFPEPPASFWTDFTSRVMRKITTRDVPAPTRRLFPFPRWTMAVAFLALFGIIGGVYLYFHAEMPQNLSPTETTGLSVPGGNLSRTSPVQRETDAAMAPALRQIASEELQQEMLESDLALFDGTPMATLDLDESDETLYFLINSLTAEEKQALLSELYKMRDTSQ